MYIILKYICDFKCVPIQRCKKLQKPELRKVKAVNIFFHLMQTWFSIIHTLTGRSCYSMGQKRANIPRNGIYSTILLGLKSFRSQMARYQQVYLWAIIRRIGTLSSCWQMGIFVLLIMSRHWSHSIFVYDSILVECALLIPWPNVGMGWGLHHRQSLC